LRLLYILARFIIVTPFKIIYWIFKPNGNNRHYEEDEEFTNNEYEEEEAIVDCECPEFQQIFEIGDDLILGIEFVSRRPDETAFVRVVGDTWVGEQYKKKVYTVGDKRFIKLDATKLYLK